MTLTATWIPLLIALVAGITMAVQGSLNTALSKVIGLLEANLAVHLIGTVFTLLLLFLFHLGRGDLGRWHQVPWYTYLGGILSVVIIYTVMASITKVGVANATTAIIVGQVTTALLVDHFGLFGLEAIPLTWWKFVGVLLLAAGAKLMLN